MRKPSPNDIHALPSLRSEPWYDARSVNEFFDDESLADRVDATAAAAFPSEGAVFHTKLERVVDMENAISYVTVTWEGRLIGMFVAGGGDSFDRFVTDIDGWRAARDHAVSFLPRDEAAIGDIVDAAAPVERLLGREGSIVVEFRGETRLVDVDHVDDAGRLVFDDVAYRKAFDRLVRPHLGVGFGSRAWRDDAAVRKALCESAAEALVGAERSAILDHALPPDSGKLRKVDWLAAVMATDEGTYVVGVSPYVDVDEMRVVRLGGTELYDGIAARKVEPENEEPMPSFPAR